MLLNRKAKARENVISAQAKTLKKRDDELLELQATIRYMDNQLWSMAQCSSWTQMQPIFADLMVEVTHRKKAESDRIQAVLLPEMRKAYSHGN
jgi:hypothetical protein